MNYAASIAARLGVDTKPFSTGMNQAATDAQRAGDKIASGTNRAAAAHDNLLKSNSRVSHQVRNFSRDLLSGADASQVMASGVEALARSMKLSLGALAGLEVGGLLLIQAKKLRDEFSKFREEARKTLDELGASPAELHSLSQLEEHLKNLDSQIAKLQARKQATQGFFGSLWEGLKYGLAGYTPSGAVREENKNRRDLDSSEVDSQRTRAAIAKKKERELDIEGSGAASDVKKALKLQNELKEKIADTGTPGSKNENQLLSMQFRRELEMTMSEVVDSIRNKMGERIKATLAEVAGRSTYSNSLSPTAAYEGERAREAMREYELAKHARETIGGKAGLEQAQLHQDRGDQLVNGIESVKDSEKIGAELKQALSQTEALLTDIKANTGGSLLNK